MEEIGEKLKEARESIGVSIDEVADDLKMRPSQIESLEKGDSKAFKDLFSLKYFIRDYAKYLGLNKEDLVDEFNEYLFDYTSKISLEDIKNAKKETKDVRKIKSPYTIDKGTKHKMLPFVVAGGLIILICLIVYLAINIFGHKGDDFVEGDTTTYIGS